MSGSPRTHNAFPFPSQARAKVASRKKCNACSPEGPPNEISVLSTLVSPFGLAISIRLRNLRARGTDGPERSNALQPGARCLCPAQAGHLSTGRPRCRCARALIKRAAVRRCGDGSNLVDPASSHTLVSKIKPCMSKYKRKRNCEWLIISVIVYLIVPYYMDTRSNSRANTCIDSQLLRRAGRIY